MERFTGNKDADREILLHIEDDRDFLKTCNLNTYFGNEVCNDNLFRRRLEMYYPDVKRSLYSSKSWKDEFLKNVWNIAKMKEEFGFNYKSGDPIRQYRILSKKLSMTGLMYSAAASEDLFDLFLFAIEKGADAHVFGETPLKVAAINGNLKTVKYLVEQKGADIHAKDDLALKTAAINGELEVVKYLIEKGSDVRPYVDELIQRVEDNMNRIRGAPEVVKREYVELINYLKKYTNK